MVTHEGKEMSVTVSIGVSCTPKDTKDEKKLFERADECLYFAKENGRNQVNTYFQGLKLRYGEKVDVTLLKQVMVEQDTPTKDKPPKDKPTRAKAVNKKTSGGIKKQSGGRKTG